MKEVDIKNLLPDLPEATEKGIAEAADNFLKKFGKTLSKDDAVKYAKLRIELGFWLDIEKTYEERGIPKDIVNELSGDSEKGPDQDMTAKQIYLKAEKSLLATIMNEKVRINEEAQSLISKYKKS